MKDEDPASYRDDAHDEFAPIKGQFTHDERFQSANHKSQVDPTVSMGGEINENRQNKSKVTVSDPPSPTNTSLTLIRVVKIHRI